MTEYETRTEFKLRMIKEAIKTLKKQQKETEKNIEEARK